MWPMLSQSRPSSIAELKAKITNKSLTTEGRWESGTGRRERRETEARLYYIIG